MMMIGYGDSAVNHDFYAYNTANQIWNGSAFVSWSDGDYASYRVPATQQGTSGRFTATLPTGAVRYEMRVRGASLAASYVVWTGDNARDLIASADGKLGGQVVFTNTVIATTGALTTLFIGDDYEGTRSLVWTVTNPPIVPDSCRLAFNRMGKKYLETVGVVTLVSSGVYSLTFALDKDATATIPEGDYDYSVEIRDTGGTEVTIAHSETAFPAKWVRKFT